MGEHGLARMRVLLDWKRDAKHAVLVEAEQSGAYARSGLTVQLVDPAEKSADSLEMVFRGSAEAAINYPHNMMCLRDACPGMVSFGALIKNNPQGLLSLQKAHIDGPRDLPGRKVGIGPSHVSRAQFDMFLQTNAIEEKNVEVLTVGFEGEELLLNGEIDALDAVAYAIPRTRRKGAATSFISYTASGIPDSPFLVFAARQDWLEANLPRVREFLAVTARAVPVVESWGPVQWQDYVRELPGKSAEEEREVWDATLPLMRGTGPLFWQDISGLENVASMLLQSGLMKGPCNVSEMFLNLA